MDALIQYGLMPQDGVERKKLEKLDPYELRAKGIGEETASSPSGPGPCFIYTKDAGLNPTAKPIREIMKKARSRKAFGD